MGIREVELIGGAGLRDGIKGRIVEVVGEINREVRKLGSKG